MKIKLHMNKQLSSELEIPWGPIGYIVYKRTYSRIKDDGSSEEFLDTIDRVLNACKTQLGFNITREEYKIYLKYCRICGQIYGFTRHVYISWNSFI